MRLGRSWRLGMTLVLAGAALLPACGRRRPAEVNDIVPSFAVNRPSAPLGTPIEVTYSWKVEPTAKQVARGYRALVHFVDTKGVTLFEDDHVPVPPPWEWQPGQTYTYTRTKFIPIYPYSGEAEVRMGLYPEAGRGERIALKGEDTGLREYRVSKLRLLPQTENTLFLIQKEGWHTPETSPQNPGLERQWTKKDAVINFKNPKKDVVVYLKADTNREAFPQPPVLTLSVAGQTGVTIPIENSEVFLKKIRFRGDALGDAEWVELRLAMNQSFVPKELGMNQDERELGLLVYQLFVGEADLLGPIPGEAAVDAGPLSSAGRSVTKVPAVKPTVRPASVKTP